MKTVTQIISLILVVLLGCTKSNQSDSQNPKDLMSSIKLTELSGDPLDLTTYKGKTVFINFWATWCKPCIQEMPTLVNAQEKFKNEKIVFLFASNEDVEQIEKFKLKHTFNFHYVQVENLEELNIQALPTTYIFDSDGKLKFSEAGLRAWDSVENMDMISKIIKHEN
jgi:thiol-disulfide isomerase/thioredoxin